MSYDEPEEIASLRESVRRLTNDRFRAKAAHWDRTTEAPIENLKVLGDNGLAGITIAEEFGGAGRQRCSRRSRHRGGCARVHGDGGIHPGELRRRPK